GLKTYLMLEPSFEVIGEASNGGEAIHMLSKTAKEHMPDLVLMDLMMPEMNGIEATKVLSEQYPQLKIVMLTSFLEDEKVYQSIEAGAVSYVLKTVSAEDLIFALKGALKGMPVMTAEVSQSLTR